MKSALLTSVDALVLRDAGVEIELAPPEDEDELMREWEEGFRPLCWF